MSDIVRRLRLTHFMDGHELGMTKQRAEAADEIERLLAELAEMTDSRDMFQRGLAATILERDTAMQELAAARALLREAVRGSMTMTRLAEWYSEAAREGGR